MRASRSTFAVVLLAASLIGAKPRSCGAGAEDPPRPRTLDAIVAAHAIELPTSGVVDPPSNTGGPALTLVVDRKELTLEGDRFPIASLPSDPSKGFAAERKWHGADSFLLLPLGHALEGAHMMFDAGPDLSTPPVDAIVVVAERTMPFRMLLEIVYSASFASFSRVSLAVKNGAQIGRIELTSARAHATLEAVQPLYGSSFPQFAAVSNEVRVTLHADRIDVALDGVALAPGCRDAGTGPAIPGAPSSDSFGALAACVATVRLGARTSQELDGSVGADDAIPIADVTRAIEAMRTPGPDGLALPAIGLFIPPRAGAR